MKDLRILVLWVATILVSGCGNDGPPPAPGAVQLIFPEESSECTTGVPVNDELSRVTFEWSASDNTETYRLTVLNLNTNIPQTLTTATTSASLSIGRGTPFSWSVTAMNSQSQESTASPTWLFYNAGSQTTYAPFPAQLIVPVSGSTITPNDSGEAILDWLGADVENDIEVYEVFFSNQNPPTASLGTLNAFTTEISVPVDDNTVYFWQVITTDAEGNTSDSGVFEFKTL